MNPNNSERSWWRRLARRKRASAPRTNRLSHFEPLEQRTVLSASPFMTGDGDFFRTQHDAHGNAFGGLGNYMAAYEASPQHEFFGGNHFGTDSHNDFAFRGPIFVPFNHDDGLLPIGGLTRDTSIDQPLRPAFDSVTSEGESSSASSLTTLVAPPLESGTAYKVEIVIVHDDEPATPTAAAVVITPIATSRMTILTPMYVNDVDSGIFATLAAAAMQRRVETPAYPAPSRYGSLNAMSEEAGAVPGKSAESTLQSSSSSLLATLITGNGASAANSAHISMTDDEGGSGEHALTQDTASRSQDESLDDTDELTAADPTGQKRKLASSDSRAVLQTRLENLTEIPIIRITESLFRELLVMYENTAPTSEQSPQAGEADDGMIELLAADVGAVAARNIATPAADAQPVTMDRGIALYQSLEVAGLEDIAEIAAAVQGPAAPVAPTDQLAKAE